MGFLMPILTSRLNKAFIAIIALVELLAGMDFLMLRLISRLNKAFIAIIALVELLAGMASPMLFLFREIKHFVIPAFVARWIICSISPS